MEACKCVRLSGYGDLGRSIPRLLGTVTARVLTPPLLVSYLPVASCPFSRFSPCPLKLSAPADP